MENNIELMKKLYLEKEQFKAIAEQQSKLLKESTESLQKLKSENTTLKKQIDLACSMLQELCTRIENQCNIDFPNSKKGGQGEQETPLNFPDSDSNLF